MPDSEGIEFDFQSKPLSDWEVEDVQSWLRAGAAREAGWEKKLSAGTGELQPLQYSVFILMLGYMSMHARGCVCERSGHRVFVHLAAERVTGVQHFFFYLEPHFTCILFFTINLQTILLFSQSVALRERTSQNYLNGARYGHAHMCCWAMALRFSTLFVATFQFPSTG